MRIIDLSKLFIIKEFIPDKGFFINGPYQAERSIKDNCDIAGILYIPGGITYADRSG